MATLKRATTLCHQPNLGEGIEAVDFQQGEEVTVLKQWGDRCLCRNAAGLLFNIPLELLQLD